MIAALREGVELLTMHGKADPQQLEQFEVLLEFLRSSRAFDFTAYKRTTLMRRVLRRMHAVSVDGFAAYQDYLEAHPEEVTHLFNMILINVTSFFRDAPVWQYLEEAVVPALVSRSNAADPIRVWSAGCASGEEACSLAMLFANALGLVRFRECVKIYATDVDDDALNQARAAAYTERDVQCLAPELVDRYFERANGKFTFHKDLRRSVIFGRHDLLQDAPISRVSLLTCRNTLMYFNAEAQIRVLDRFEFALIPGGYLVMGKAEMILGRLANIVPVDLKRRVFIKLQATPRERPFVASGIGSGVGVGLAVVRQLVALHEGRIELISTPGQGAQFVVRLPVDGPTRTGAEDGPIDPAMRHASTPESSEE